MATDRGGPLGGSSRPEGLAHNCGHPNCQEGPVSCPVVQYCGSKLCSRSLGLLRSQAHDNACLATSLQAHLTLMRDELTETRSQLTTQASMNSRASGAQTGHFEIGSDNTCLREEIGRLRVRTRELEARLRQMNEVCAKEQAGGQAKYQNELADTQEDNAKALAATKAKHAKAINAIREPSQNAHPTPAERFGEATSSKLARIIRMCEDLEKVLSDKSASLTAPESEIHEDHRNVVASTPASNMAKSPVVNQISESMNANTFPDIPAIEVAGKAWTKAKGSRNNSAEASHEPQSDSSRLTQSQKYALANVSMTDAEPAELQHKLQAAVVPSPHYISSRISKSSIVPAKPVSHDERMKQRGKELRSAWYEKNAGTNVTTPRAFREESRRATGPSAAESDQSDSDSEMTEDTSSSGGEVGDEVLNEDMLDLVQAMGRLSLG